MSPFSQRAVLVGFTGSALLAAICALVVPSNPWLSSLVGTAPRWILLLWLPFMAVSGWPRALGVVGVLAFGLPSLGGPARVSEGYFRVVAANVQAFADPSAALDEALAQMGADVLITIEERGHQVPGLTLYARWQDQAKGSDDLAVWCRDACEVQIVGPFGSGEDRLPVATVAIGDVCVLGLHIPPPQTGGVAAQAGYVDALEAVLEPGGRSLAVDFGACKRGQSPLWVGDFNAGVGSALYRRVAALGLRDGLAWPKVLSPSWPAGGGWPGVPVLRLDHVFVAEGLVVEANVRRLPNSDHRAVVVDLAR